MGGGNTDSGIQFHLTCASHSTSTTFPLPAHRTQRTGLPALGSTARLCGRPREAGPGTRSGTPDRSASGHPESARLPGLRLGTSARPSTRALCRTRPRPPLRGSPKPASHSLPITRVRARIRRRAEICVRAGRARSVRIRPE